MVEPPKKKLKGSSTILDFFPRKSAADNVLSLTTYHDMDVSLGVNTSELTDDELQNDDYVTDSESSIDDQPDPGSISGESSLLLPIVGPYDLGTLRISLLKGRFSDDDKYKHLDQPQQCYEFPAVKEGKQLRRFQSSWFSKYPWLAYSKSENGGYCAYCLIFSSSVKKGGNLGALVQSPLVKFKKALETLASHEKTEYHKDTYTRVVSFLEYMSGRRESIVAQLNTSHAAQIQRNREVLKSIIATVEICGRQGIALRGHRDDARHLDDPDSNPGNFQALLKFRCDAGDIVLAEYFSKCARNATYRSKTTQNAIIEVLGGMITEAIIAEVNEAKFFAVISDEVQDSASIEQISLVIRYVHKDEDLYMVKESFIGFKEQHREMTGQAIAETILGKLEELGLNCEYLRGQGYDGSGSMAGIRKGASTIILQKYPLATYIHCCSHLLNLSIASSCSQVLVHNMMGSISEVSKFFEHGKRQDKLEEVIECELPDVEKKRVKPLCRTRWVERHDALEVCVDLYPAIVQALHDIAHGEDSVFWNRDTVSVANGLLSTIEKFSFLLTLVVVFNVLSYIKGLTVLLQQQSSLDIVKGIEMVQEVQEELKEVREEVDDWYKIWFKSAIDMAEEAQTEMPSIPRRCSRQMQWANVEAEVPEVYYRRSLTIPFLDHILQEMEDRFSLNAKMATLGLCLVPSVISKTDNWQESVKDLASLYQVDLPAPLSLHTELHCWKHKFMHCEPYQLPDNPLDALNECDSRLFPNVYILLKIICTIPVTSCEAERSFSALHRIKPFLRTTMAEDRLSGLTLLHMHRKISVCLDDAVDCFARKHPRKLQLL